MEEDAREHKKYVMLDKSDLLTIQVVPTAHHTLEPKATTNVVLIHAVQLMG